MNQSDINYRPHSRPKKYVMILPQLRSSVQPDTRINRFQLRDFRRYPKLSAATAIVWMFVIIGCGWGIYELLFG